MVNRLCKNQNKGFDDVLLETIDEALTCLGEEVKISIYFHVERTFFLPLKEIPFRIGDFSTALEKIFGPSARYLELLIMKKLHEKIKCQYKWEGPKWLVPDLTFQKYVALVKLCYEDKGKMEEPEVLILVEQQEQLL